MPGIPALTLSPTSLAFSNQTVGTTSAAQTVTVSNTGIAPMTINNISMGGMNPLQFAQSNTCGIFPATLAPGATCSINVKFNPTLLSSRSASISVNVAAPAVSKSVSLTGTATPHYPPIANATCLVDQKASYTVQVTDSSTNTDGSPVKNVVVNWGDGATSDGLPGSTFTHSYSDVPFRAYLTHLTAYDTVGKIGTFSCVVKPPAFTIRGTVYEHDGTTPVPLAIVWLKLNGKLRESLKTASDGTFAFETPAGSYTLQVYKYGYTFADTAPITVGPSSVGNTISALTP